MMLFGTLDGQALLFWFFALLTCGFALAVLFSANIVRMAFYLVLSLGASAGLFFLTGAEFVGAMQLMIYVGGTLVLLIFGVMLTAQSRFVTMQTPAGDWILAALAGGLLLVVLAGAALHIPSWTTPHPERASLKVEESKTTTQIGLALAGVRVDRTEQKNPTLREGMSGYLLPFVIISVHLLVVLIGAAYMARAKRRVTTQEAGG